MQDPVSDMLTQIRNGQQARHKTVTLSSSNLKTAILTVLKDEGYITDFNVEATTNNKSVVTVTLKYFKDAPVIDRIKRISRPGLRVYKSSKQLKPVPGFGVAILSTSKGVMSHLKAKALNIGGELLCEVA